MDAKAYLIGISAGRGDWAATLAEAKKVGLRLGKLTERNDTKWNLSYVTVTISKKVSPGFYKATGWRMLVPVRGTGARRETTVASIRRRFGVAPYKWFRR